MTLSLMKIDTALSVKKIDTALFTHKKKDPSQGPFSGELIVESCSILPKASD